MSRSDHVHREGMDNLSDADLHALIIARDERAFAEWERRTAPDVFRMIRGRGLSDEDSEEIWNNALLRVWDRALSDPPLEPVGEGLRRYAFGVASRQVAGRFRDRSRQVATVPLDDREKEPSTGLWLPDRRPTKALRALRRCMEMIEERWRIVLEMVKIEAGPDAIAAALGIGKGSVRKYIQRAKAAIRHCVEVETDV